MFARAAFAATLFLAVGAKDPSTTPINEWPMIMAHDAATTYLKGGLLHQIYDWTKTQPDGGATGLLNCGARSFDWCVPPVHRPSVLRTRQG